MPLEFKVGTRFEEAFLPATVTANDADTVHHLAREGFGLVQAPKYRFLDWVVHVFEDAAL